ncbi:hypothetical protein BGZ54_001203 [Gamsiella multidivaricata]|nr:hypothetical protein BGZ54_001203 [Gamsiella multidivaricata]
MQGPSSSDYVLIGAFGFALGYMIAVLILCSCYARRYHRAAQTLTQTQLEVQAQDSGGGGTGSSVRTISPTESWMEMHGLPEHSGLNRNDQGQQQLSQMTRDRSRCSGEVANQTHACRHVGREDRGSGDRVSLQEQATTATTNMCCVPFTGRRRTTGEEGNAGEMVTMEVLTDAQENVCVGPISLIMTNDEEAAPQFSSTLPFGPIHRRVERQRHQYAGVVPMLNSTTSLTFSSAEGTLFAVPEHPFVARDRRQPSRPTSFVNEIVALYDLAHHYALAPPPPSTPVDSFSQGSESDEDAHVSVTVGASEGQDV